MPWIAINSEAMRLVSASASMRSSIILPAGPLGLAVGKVREPHFHDAIKLAVADLHRPCIPRLSEKLPLGRDQFTRKRDGVAARFFLTWKRDAVLVVDHLIIRQVEEKREHRSSSVLLGLMPSTRGRSNRVRHRRPALAERPFGASRGVAGGLMLDLGIEFGADQDDDGGN